MSWFPLLVMRSGQGWANQLFERNQDAPWRDVLAAACCHEEHLSGKDPQVGSVLEPGMLCCLAIAWLNSIYRPFTLRRTWAITECP